ncbi:MAG TPA: HlyD family efflux transporter periplasmic adaptor subunit [Gemmatimonadaceae bacterium]
MDIKREPKKNTKKYVLYGLLGVVLVAVTIGLVNLKPAAQSVDRLTLIIDSVRQGDMVRDVSAPGTLVPEHIRIVPAVNAGRVELLPLRPGATVQPGTMIVELVDPNMELQVLQYQQTLSQAITGQANLRTSLQQTQMSQENAIAALRTQYKTAQRNAVVFDSLDKRGLASKNEVAGAHDALEELKTRLALETQRLEEMKRSSVEQLRLSDEQVENARAILEEQKKRLSQMKVVAGEAGVLQTLGNPQLEYGQWITPGMELARIAQPGRLKAVLRVPDTQAKDIVVGQVVSIDLHNNSTATGRVIRADPSAQAGNVTVEVSIDGTLPPGVRDGQTVDGKIVIENLKNVLNVGRPSYGNAPGKVGLWKLTPDQKEATLVPVDLGSASVSNVQVLKGLKVGDKIIISDMSQYEDQQRIRIK